MKDLKVIKDSRLVPIEPGGSGSPAIIIVRNNDVNGRRLGVFTKTGNAVIGQRVNHADALHEVKSLSALPDGYNSGVEVNLSSKRNYHYFATYMLGNGFGQTLEGMGWFAYGAVRQDGALKLSENTINLEKLRTTLKSGESTAASDTSFSMRNSFASFSLVFAGITYHIGLDVAKHPAHITADLNFRLNRIHPQLRGYVTKNEVVYEDRIPLMFYIAAPEGLDVTIPLTTFPVDAHLSPSVDETEHDDGTFHLNNKLTSALLIDNVYGVRETTNTVSTVSPTAVIKTTEQLIDEAFVVDLNAFTHEVETPTLYKGRVTIPANAFKTWNRDQRLNLAILKLKRDYDAGRVFRLLSVRYKTSAGTDIDFTNQFADILVMPAPAEGDTVSSIYLDEMESVEVDRLQGYAYSTAEEMKFPESGGLNEESAMYIGVLATPTPETRNSIFFRHTVAATYLEIEYELVEADVIPTVKIDDLGTLDYHYINTEEHAFLPIAFSTAPVHNWDIEFITDGQAERYQGLNNGPLLDEDNIHITTQGTVGEAVILAGIDYSKVLAPTVEEPLYHYLGDIGADVWLNQNLPYVNVKTFREVNPVRSNYKVIFPAVAMTGTLVPLEEPLIAKQTDGTIEITGRFHNPTYPKNVFLHSTLTSWSWNLKGADVQPADVVNFDAATGIFSTRFAIDDLVEYGPGLHTFRVTAQAKYPWLAQPTQYSVSMDIQVLPAVEGIEDDVTFISASQYDTEVSSESTGGYRLVDLDTGEVLATGSNAHNLKVDATARGLVQIDLIMGEVFVPEAEIVPISCEGATNAVNIDIEGEWVLEIEGVIVGSGTMEDLKPIALTQDVEITTPEPVSAHYEVTLKNFKVMNDEGFPTQHNNTTFYAAVSVNGVVYNADKSKDLSAVAELEGILGSYMDSSGRYTIYNAGSSVINEVILSPSEEQLVYTDALHVDNQNQTAVILPTGDIKFSLGVAP